MALWGSVLTVVSVLAAGVGAGGLSPSSDAMPVPMPQVGDHGRYVYQVIVDPDAGAERAFSRTSGDGNRPPNGPESFAPYLDFEIRAPTLVEHAGATVAAYEARVVQYGAGPNGTVVAGLESQVWADARTLLPLRAATARVVNTTADGRDFTTSETETYDLRPAKDADAPRGPDPGVPGASVIGGPQPQLTTCLLFSPAQGRPLGNVQRILTGCHLPLFYFEGGMSDQLGLATASAPLHLDRTEQVDGRPAKVYRAAWHQESIEIWMSPATAYPLRIVQDAHWGDENPHLNYVTTIALDRLVLGNGTLPPASQRSSFTSPASTAPQTSRSQPWGMDQAGFDGALGGFTPAKAWRMVLDNHTELAEYPGAGATRYEERAWTDTVDTTREAVWRFVLVRPGKEQTVDVRLQRIEHASAISPLLPPAIRPSETKVLFDVHPPQVAERASLADYPTMPSVQGLSERLRSELGREAEGWSFDLGNPSSHRATWKAWSGSGPTYVELTVREDGRVETTRPHTTPAPVTNGRSLAPMVAGIRWTMPSATWVVGTTALATAVGALVTLATGGFKGAGLALFSRVKDDGLDHPQRRRLLEIVKAEPGLHFRELQRRAGLGGSNALHHLRKLVELGDIEGRKQGRYMHYYPRGARDRPQPASPGAQAILRALQARALAPAELARACSLAPSTISHHVGHLQRAGVVSRGPDGRIRLSRT